MFRNYLDLHWSPLQSFYGRCGDLRKIMDFAVSSCEKQWTLQSVRVKNNVLCSRFKSVNMSSRDSGKEQLSQIFIAV